MELYLKENINMKINCTVLLNSISDLLFYPVILFFDIEVFRMFLQNRLCYVEITEKKYTILLDFYLLSLLKYCLKMRDF